MVPACTSQLIDSRGLDEHSHVGFWLLLSPAGDGIPLAIWAVFWSHVPDASAMSWIGLVIENTLAKRVLMCPCSMASWSVDFPTAHGRSVGLVCPRRQRGPGEQQNGISRCSWPPRMAIVIWLACACLNVQRIMASNYSANYSRSHNSRFMH